MMLFKVGKTQVKLLGKKNEDINWADKLAAAGSSAASGLTFGLVSPETMYKLGGKIWNVTKWTNPGYLAWRGGKALYKWMTGNQKQENANQMLKIEEERLNSLNIEQQKENDTEIKRIQDKLNQGKKITETEKLQMGRNTVEGEKAYQEHISNKENLQKMNISELENVKSLAENELDRQKEKTQAQLDSTMASIESTTEENGITKLGNKEILGIKLKNVLPGLSLMVDDLPEALKNKKLRELAEGQEPSKIKKALSIIDNEIALLTKQKEERYSWNIVGKNKDQSQIDKLIQYKEAVQKRLNSMEELRKKEEQVKQIKDVTFEKEQAEKQEYGLVPDKIETNSRS